MKDFRFGGLLYRKRRIERLLRTTLEIAPISLPNRPAGELPHRRNDVATELVDGEAIIHDVGRGLVTYLNASAAVIWQLCNGERTEAEIAQLLAAEMPEVGSLAADVTEAIAGFRRAGLLA